ncbi:hypothetical protein [Polymorphum gilvum]|uniref:Uncharacterized protein n=1 Tax=Polymorphum gilvum (strain LMG 25793 / CGMCC 1.9160 / SL003B-26A1) TaxID=991905 RepID=F2J0K7_POLGS|nr:hypothetical protein [Polymorphum gilvum]ADZ69675.1 hypothetical protein SL003B_1246 [Polymorphum gilvum SL003B-26A1]
MNGPSFDDSHRANRTAPAGSSLVLASAWAAGLTAAGLFALAAPFHPMLALLVAGFLAMAALTGLLWHRLERDIRLLPTASGRRRTGSAGDWSGEW